MRPGVFFASVSLLVGREGVEFPQFLQGSAPHASWFPPLFTQVPRPWRASKFFFYKRFVAGREEGCRVPPIFAGVCASRVMVPSTATQVHRPWRVSMCIFCKIFVAGREEGCRVPPNFCRGPRLTRQSSLYFSHGSPGLAVCPGVVFASVPLLVGRKGVGFPQFLQGPTPHTSGFPLLFSWVPKPWRVSRCVFCRHFAAGLEEGCSVPLVFAGAHASRVMVPSTFHTSPQALACVQFFGFCKRFAALWEEGFRVSPVFAEVPPSRVRVPSTVHMGPLALACFQVYFVQTCRCWSGGSVQGPPGSPSRLSDACSSRAR